MSITANTIPQVKPVSWFNYAISKIVCFTYSAKWILCAYSVGIASRYGLGGPRFESRLGGEIFRTRPDRPWGQPSLLYNGYRVFSEGKTAGTWHWPPTPSSAEVKERAELYLYSPSGSSWPVLEWNLLLLYWNEKNVHKSVVACLKVPFPHLAVQWLMRLLAGFWVWRIRFTPWSSRGPSGKKKGYSCRDTSISFGYL